MFVALRAGASEAATARVVIRSATGAIHRKLDTGDTHQILVSSALIIRRASRLPKNVPVRTSFRPLRSTCR